MSIASIDSTGNNGPCPILRRYVLVAAITSDVVIDVVDGSGSTVLEVTLPVVATPKNVKQLIEAAGSTWDDAYIGARILTLSADVSWNTSGNLLTTGYAIAPDTTNSASIAAGNYKTDPIKMGVCN